MKPYKYYILVMCFYSVMNSFSQKTYYLSENGDDKNTGLDSNQSWQNLSKISDLNSEMLSNSTILLKRGDVFRGQIILQGNANDVVIGAYGQGRNPVISGSVKIEGWTQFKNQIYSAPSAINTKTQDSHFFVNKYWMSPARYPNSGMFVSSSISDSSRINSIQLLSLKLAENYLSGANIKIRTNDVLYETKQIRKSNVDGNLYLSSPIESDGKNCYFFLDQKFDLMDSVGEWYHDVMGATIFFFNPYQSTINQILCELTIEDYGIYVDRNMHYVTIQNIDFEHQKKTAITITESQNITIQNCTFSSIGESAIGVEINTKDITIKDNKFIQNFNHSIHVQSNINSKTNINISGNLFTNNGVFPGYGSSYDLQMSAVVVLDASNCKIHQNKFLNIGNFGIYIRGNQNIISNNYLNGSSLLLNNGSGIATFGNNTQIINNIVLYSSGNSPMKQRADGITILQTYGVSQGLQIVNNTVAYNQGYGIYGESLLNSQIRKNTCFANQIQFGLFPYINAGFSLNYGNNIENNIFYSISEKQLAIELDSRYIYGYFSSNYFFNPYNNMMIKYTNTPYIQDVFSYESWKELYPGLDSKSTTNWYFFKKFSPDSIGENLINNGNFNDYVNNWVFTNLQYSIEPNLSSFSSNILKLSNTLSSSNFASQKFDLQQNTNYFISLKTGSDSKTSCRLKIIANTIPETEIYSVLLSCEPDITTKEFSFVTSKEFKDCKVVFDLLFENKTYYFDDIKVSPSKLTYNNPNQYNKLIFNDSTYSKTFLFEKSKFWDIDNNELSNSISLEPNNSKILVFKGGVLPIAGAKNKNTIPNFQFYSHENELYIVFNTKDEYQIQILDLTGRLIKSLNFNGLQTKVVVNKKGIFVLRITNKRGETNAKLINMQ